MPLDVILIGQILYHFHFQYYLIYSLNLLFHQLNFAKNFHSHTFVVSDFYVMYLMLFLIHYLLFSKTLSEKKGHKNRFL